MREVDAVDARLLGLLQVNSQRTNVELAREVGLSAAAVHKRMRRLRDEGVIERYTVILNRRALDLKLLCFIEVRFRDNMRPDNRSQLSRALARFPEVLECFTLTGNNDAIMKVLVRDQEHLKDFVQALAESQEVIDRIYTSLVLDEYKSTTAVPLPGGRDP